MWFLIILAILGGILLWPIQLVAAYDAKGGRVYIRYGLLVLSLYPGKDKPSKVDTGQTESAQPDDAKGPGKSKLDGWLDYLQVLKCAFEPICELHRHLRIDRLKLKVVLAKEDPCDLSVLYGRTWAVVSDLLVRLNSYFKIKDQCIDLRCDYTGDHTAVEAYTRISITTVRLLYLLLRYGVRIINEYTAIKNRRKGGITNEQTTS